MLSKWMLSIVRVNKEKQAGEGLEPETSGGWSGNNWNGGSGRGGEVMEGMGRGGGVAGGAAQQVVGEVSRLQSSLVSRRLEARAGLSKACRARLVVTRGSRKSVEGGGEEGGGGDLQRLRPAKMLVHT